VAWAMATGLRLRPQHGGDARTLPPAGLGDADERGIRAPEIFGRLLALAPRDAVELLHQAAHAAGAGAEGLRRQLRRVAEHAPRPSEQAADDAHAVAEGLAVGRVADGRLDYRAVDAQLAPARDARLPRQGDHPVVEGRHRRAAAAYRATGQASAARFAGWRAVTGTPALA